MLEIFCVRVRARAGTLPPRPRWVPGVYLRHVVVQETYAPGCDYEPASYDDATYGTRTMAEDTIRYMQVHFPEVALETVRYVETPETVT
jgi:hypothetical protein